MERTAILATMGELKLYGMRAAFDAIITAAVKRQHEPQQVIGDFVSAEIAEKQARSIKYQITTAKLPLAKDVDEFGFDGTPVNEALVRDLAGAGSWPSSATWCSSVAPARAKPIWLSPLPGPASAMERADGSTTWLTW
ncbi:Transposase (plasmid) [Roseomonas mucosa]|nr:Transposase [Roseomonas mucosa]